jgi:hypothetical protein
LEEAIKTKVSTLSGGERNRLHDDFKEERKRIAAR